MWPLKDDAVLGQFCVFGISSNCNWGISRKQAGRVNVPHVMLKFEDWLDCHSFHLESQYLTGKSFFWRRGWVRTSEGEGKRWSSADLKGFSSLCDPCNIKAHLPNPRQCSLCCPCIWQTSWVSAGRIQPLLCDSKGTQRSGKCRARPSVCPASH